jgi:integrase
VLEKKNTFSEAAANKYIQALNHYSKWKGLSLDIPKQFREHCKTRQTFSDSDIENILKVKNRYTSFFGLLAYTGARPHEILDLEPEQIDKSLNVLRLRVTKTSEDRVVPIPDSAIPYLSGIPFDFTDQAARDELKKRCKNLKIRYRPLYSFRHSLITRLIDSGAPIFSVMALAGHKQADTTLHYYHTSITHLRKALESDTLNISSMPADKRLELLKKHLRETIERLKLSEDFTVEVVERENEVKLRVKKK